MTLAHDAAAAQEQRLEQPRRVLDLLCGTTYDKL